MVLVCFIAISIIFVLLFLYSKMKQHPEIPGPFTLPIIGGAYVFLGHASAELIIDRCMTLVRKYNGTMAIWMGSDLQVIISKPEHVQAYCTSHTLLDHAPLYDFFKPALGNGLFTTNGADWKTTRKAWAPSFHPSLLRHFVKTFRENSNILLQVLEKEAGGMEFPAFPYLRNYFLDVIFETQMQYKHNSQCEQRELNEAVEPLNEILYSRLFMLHLQIDWIFYLSRAGRNCAKIIKGVYHFLDDFVDVKKRDLLKEGTLPADDWKNKLFVRQLFNERNLNKKKLYDEILTLGVTGYETVARAAGFTLLMLGKHQDIQNKVLEEDKEIQKQLNGRELELDDLQKYEYLERVIKETLRIFPVGPLLGRSASEDIKIGDLNITKGTSVVCFVLALHRDPEIYHDPLKFNPDNFLPEKIAERHPYSYIPFSAGPRGCIGSKYGMTALKVMLPALIRKYRVISTKDVADIGLKVEVTMTDPAGFPIRLEKRKEYF